MRKSVKKPKQSAGRESGVELRAGSLLIAVLVAAAVAGSLLAKQKLSPEQRARIVREMVAEYGTAKTIIPRSKKALEVDKEGKYDEDEWGDAMDKFGPAARLGDLIQITKVEFKNDAIVLELNHGIKGGRRWWHRIQVSGSTNRGSTLGANQSVHAPGGTKLALPLDGEISELEPDDIKNMLKPVLDFEQRSATELYMEKLPKEFQEAIKAKRVLRNMDKDMVLLAKGRPDRKVRDFKDGLETEDWIYGKPPGNITFVTFEDDKVIKIKEAYATPGGQVGIPEPPESK